MRTVSFFAQVLFTCTALFLAGCNSGGGSGEDWNTGNDSGWPAIADAFPYAGNSPFASAVEACVKTADAGCTLATLPFIGTSAPVPGVADIMDRVLVSHDWMGSRFEEVLNRMPAHVLSLFRPVTAIVIDADVRPSFYMGDTGALYIDPMYLWSTNAEKQTVSRDADYRSSFSADLAFIAGWRYVRDNAYAYTDPGAGLLDDSERTLDDIVLSFSRLLYHELAHANDILPWAYAASLPDHYTTHDAWTELVPYMLWKRLEADYPLTSEELADLAEVMFGGRAPTVDEQAVQADYVGAVFDLDRANDHYSYYTPREDVAMLFEETMMAYDHGIQRDVGYIIRTDSDYCDDYLVGWGVRGRIGQSQVRQRAQLVATTLLPDVDFSAFFAALEPQQSMTAGAGWCDNLDLVAGARSLPLTRARQDARFRFDMIGIHE